MIKILASFYKQVLQDITRFFEHTSTEKNLVFIKIDSKQNDIQLFNDTFDQEDQLEKEKKKESKTIYYTFVSNSIEISSLA